MLRIVANEFHSGRLVYDDFLFVHDARLSEGNHLNEQASLEDNNADESVTEASTWFNGKAARASFRGHRTTFIEAPVCTSIERQRGD